MGAFAAALAARLRDDAAASGTRPAGEWVWPSAEYRSDIVRFARIEMGVEFTEQELELVEAVQNHPRVAASGGRKVGKDFAIAIVAIWFYCSFPRARVRFTAVNGEQVRDVFWREVKMRLAESGRCLDCKRLDPGGPRPCPHAHPILEEPATLPKTGLRSEDFREIVGLTASSEEAAAGVSGAYQLNIIDEASDVEEFVFEAVDGNLGGCALGKVIMLSNPTRNVGRFFDAFHEKSSAYKTLYLSSRETPNARAGKLLIPGLATADWIREMVEIYGEESQWVTIHIDGRFVRNPEGTVFSLEAIDASFMRWREAKAESDVLQVGADIAGAGDRADESGFAARRGDKILECYGRTGLDPDSGAHLIEVLGLIAKHRMPGDTIRVAIDREGEQGAKAWHHFEEYLAAKEHEAAFALIGVRASERAQREPHIYERVRDELVASLARWLREGGSMPEDKKIRAQLNAHRWIPQTTGRSRLMSKDDMRKILGRSPDLADALALSVWSPYFLPSTAGGAQDGGSPPAAGGTWAAGEAMDVHHSNEWWRSR